MIEIKCRVCNTKIIKGHNYPDTFLRVEFGVDICNDCWHIEIIPDYLPSRQAEKYLILQYRKNKNLFL